MSSTRPATTLRVRLSATVLAVLVGLTAGCGVRQRLFGGRSLTRSGRLSVLPPRGPAGSTFFLVASGFKPGEAMTFEIDVPHQSRFVGPRHLAGPDGKVSSAYSPLISDPPGLYRVKAVGAGGTRAQARLTIVAGAPPTSTG
jgi:hypothetical protein